MQSKALFLVNLRDLELTSAIDVALFTGLGHDESQRLLSDLESRRRIRPYKWDLFGPMPFMARKFQPRGCARCGRKCGCER